MAAAGFICLVSERTAVVVRIEWIASAVWAGYAIAVAGEGHWPMLLRGRRFPVRRHPGATVMALVSTRSAERLFRVLRSQASSR
jgi:hypothetical protein